MDSQEFLNNLLLKFDSDDCEIINMAFRKDHFKPLNESNCQKKILCISSTYFNETLNEISSLKEYLESIISLPIYEDDDNLLILIFNSKKSNQDCLFIDESDSLIHKNDSVDWTYASEELIGKIVDTYNQFLESDTSVILDVNTIFPDEKILTFKSDKFDDSDKKSINEEFLTLKSDFEDTSTRKNKVISNELADELLSLKQKQSVRDEISKHNIIADDMPQSANIPFLNDVMYYKKRQNPENLLYKENKRLIEGEVQFRKLGEIADLKNIYYKHERSSILVATCKLCNSRLVYYNKDIDDFKGEVYIEIDNISDSVSMDYLYEYLSSSNGRDELLYFSKGNNYIIPDDIKNVKIPIPPLDDQKEIVKVSRESREFFKSIELLKKEFNSNILDYKRMRNSLDEFNGEIEFDDTNEITTLSRSWRHAYKGLIWPLAISYLSATKGGFEIVEKKDNYLVLFEFIAAFNTIVLLSGLPEDVYQNNFSKIWNSRNPNEYKQLTFANWVYLSKNLAKVYKFNNFESKLDEDLFDKIADDKLLDILEFAKNQRNEEAHGSHSNAFEAQQIVDKLDVYLEDMFDILEVYSNYKLFYTTGQLNSTDPYDHNVILLNGPCAQPIYDHIILDSMLKENSLYLYNPKNNKKLLLNDNFMKFVPIDENKKHWALFIYYSCDRGEYTAFYKCFQSREKDIERSISSLERDILGKKY